MPRMFFLSWQPPDMCGIAGTFNFTPTQPIDRERLVAMTAVIAHRGPDADGFYVGPGIGLGHRRLSIIDLSTGDQPLANEDHTIRVVFNGEIYNFAEMRAELIAHGHRFRRSARKPSGPPRYAYAATSPRTRPPSWLTKITSGAGRSEVRPTSTAAASCETSRSGACCS